jgi:hypothetical protein
MLPLSRVTAITPSHVSVHIHQQPCFVAALQVKLQAVWLLLCLPFNPFQPCVVVLLSKPARWPCHGWVLLNPLVLACTWPSIQ